ncbi:MAG: ABC transporter permease, partial [Bacteroidaceae bacterium]|nr:ABC transporter permease [Bacteroidaceae bacterium]
RRCGARQRGFLLHEKYFETQGLTPIEGSPSAAQLSDECPEDGAVISRSMALALFGTDQVVGRRIMEWDFSDRALREKGGYTPVKHYTVAGVLEDFRLLSYERYAYSILVPQTRLWNLTSQMLIRLRPEVDAEAFVNKMKGTMKEELRSGNLAVISLKTYPEYQKQFAFSDYAIISTLIGLMLGLLLVNVMLGTLGTYWLQLRKRTEDIGILRSFGAKRRNIFWMVWSEITLLTLIACIIGQIIWMQFAINFGLSKGQTMTGNGQETDWVNTFWLHFLIICVIQYLLMLVIVTLGILVPSLIAMYKRPVEALRHE